MSQKVLVAQSAGKLELTQQEYSLEKEKQSLLENEFIAKVIYIPMMDLAYFQINGLIPQEFPFNPGWEASGKIIYAKNSSIIGKYVNFGVNFTGTWKEYAKGTLEAAIILDNCKNDEELKEYAGACYANPLTAIGLVETALESKDVKAVVSTAAGSSLSLMIHNILASKGIQTINIIRSSSKVQNLKQVLKTENVIATDSPTFQEELKDLIKKLQPTILFDAIGGDVGGNYLKLLPFGSRMINYSHMDMSQQIIIDLGDTLTNHKKVEGFFVNAWIELQSKEKSQQIHEQMSKQFKQFFSIKVSKTYPFEQAEEGLSYFMKNQSEGKVLLSNI